MVTPGADSFLGAGEPYVSERPAVRIGTSGWVYPHWRGLFYPEGLPQKRWLAHYASVFDTVEINNTFYRLPAADTFIAWRRQAPRGFVYAVKASRFLTHQKKLRDPEESLRLFFERARHLGESLGPILYQLPPRWRADPQRFHGFLSRLPARYTHVVEFRDQSWFVEEIFALMERFGVAHCIHDFPALTVPLRATAAPVYLRFHGDVGYSGDYAPKALEAWARRIERWRADGLPVFAYFNNDAGGYAVENARTLRDLLGVSSRGTACRAPTARERPGARPR